MMMKPVSFKRSVVLGVWMLVSLALAGCSQTDDETAIRALIAEGVQFAEAHDLGGLMDLTTDNFLAEPGALPRTEAKRFVFVGMKRYGNFRIHHPRPSIEIADNRQQATATLHFLIVNKAELFPELEQLANDPLGWLAAIDKNADLFTLSLKLLRKDDEWRVQRAKLTRFAGLQGQS